MYLSSKNVLTCFFVILDAESNIVSLSINPDENFEILSLSKFVEPEDQYLKYIKSATNRERTKALICYTIGTPKGKCLSYDINENNLNNVFIESSYYSSDLME